MSIINIPFDRFLIIVKMAELNKLLSTFNKYLRIINSLRFLLEVQLNYKTVVEWLN